MKPKTFEFRLNGLPGMLMLGVFAVIAIGVIALVLMVGAAVAVAGLAISAGAALYYALRRKLSHGAKPNTWLESKQPSATASLEVREIEVEVLPQKEC